jgi:hypothetical protein
MSADPRLAKYGQWLLANKDKKGTPEFEKVAAKYRKLRQTPTRPASQPAPQKAPSQPASPELVMEPPNALESLGGGMLAAGKGLLQGAAGVANLVPDAVIGAYNAATGSNVPTFDQRVAATLPPAQGFELQQEIASGLAPGAVAMKGMQAVRGTLEVAPRVLPRLWNAAKEGALGGLLMPSATPQDRVTNAGAGAAFGAGMQGALDAVMGGGQALYRGLIEPWADRAAIKGRAYLEAAGDRASQVAQALRGYANKATQDVPDSYAHAGEAATPAGSAEFAAFQEAASRTAPSKYLAKERANRAARLKQIERVSGTEADLEAAEAARAKAARKSYGAIENDLVEPASDETILRREIARTQGSRASALRDWGRFRTLEAQQENLASGGTVPPEQVVVTIGPPATEPLQNPAVARAAAAGAPRPPARYMENTQRVPEAAAASAQAGRIAQINAQDVRFLTNALESLKKAGRLGDVGLEDLASRPSIREALNDALKSSQERGRYFPAGDGELFSVGNLQRIKESLDAGIAAAQKATDAGRRPELTAEELISTRDAYVKWLGERVPEWKAARLQYKEMSEPVNQMNVGQYLRERLTSPLDESARQRAGMFAQALREAPRSLKRATGTSRFKKLTEVLTPEQNRLVESVRDELARGGEYEELVAAGMKSHGPGRAFSKSVDPEGALQGPSLINWKISMLNKILRRFEGKINESLAAEIAEEMLDPATVAKSMEDAMARRHGRAAGLAKELRSRIAPVGANVSTSLLKEQQ